MPFTRTAGASSRASDRTISTSAALDIEYALNPTRGRPIACMSAIATIDPPASSDDSARSGLSHLHSSNGASALTRYRASAVSAVTSASGVAPYADALSTSASSRPSSRASLAPTDSTCAWSSRSSRSSRTSAPSSASTARADAASSSLER